MRTSTGGDLDTVGGLEKELGYVKEELELMPKKETESQMELSGLQSMVAVEEEELQVQATDMESLTRNIQIKGDLIRVFQSVLKTVGNYHSSEDQNGIFTQYWVHLVLDRYLRHCCTVSLSLLISPHTK
ncbi:myomegalin-like [Dasypus novemcinctus]|uniref:myomegalin-like n=1 Tax=Dasypus novemcinctus TaxID=9361 RepID=UPI00265DC0EF|nr:myomegalin-like [Dasypus novemcinctus]